jgi:hypothetical protein
MAKIAILSSTSPLRKTSSRFGVTKQRLNTDICIQLAEKFDGVIVGSAAPDEVFDHISRNLPRSNRLKFRFYGRSFFVKHRGRDDEDDGRNAGWESILAENRVEFEPLLTRVKSDRSTEQVKFNWRRMQDFVTDPNVVFVSGSEGQLLYSRATKFQRGK